MNVCILTMHLLPLLQLQITVRYIAATQHAASREPFSLYQCLLYCVLGAKHGCYRWVLLLTVNLFVALARRRLESWATELMLIVCLGLLE
jgi:hypothetical protein